MKEHPYLFGVFSSTFDVSTTMMFQLYYHFPMTGSQNLLYKGGTPTEIKPSLYLELGTLKAAEEA